MTSHGQPPAGSHHLVIDTAPQVLSLSRLLHYHRLHLFYGDLHNHTGYSDGTGQPEEALRQMRECGLHFAAITDHGEYFDREPALHSTHRWATVFEQTVASSSADFVAIRGFEWSSPRQGHSNVWWSSEYTGYLRTGDESMRTYYQWLAAARPVAGMQEVLAGFNHPGREPRGFDSYRYMPELDHRMVTVECFNREADYGEAYFRALDQGWHVGAIGVSDHHGTEWGSARWPRAGLFAPTLTPATMQKALLARHVFATRSPTLALVLTGNAELMGTRLSLGSREALTIGVWCDDPAASGAWTRLELWTNGGTLVGASETRGLQQVRWRHPLMPQGTEERWFVVRVMQEGTPLAYSSPIWARWE